MQAGVDYRLRRTVDAVAEPVDIELAKQHIRTDAPEEVALLRDIYLPAARQMLETDTERALLSQTWVLSLNDFPLDVIELRVCPVNAVTVTYLDGSGASQTLSTSVYQLDTRNEPGRITLKYGQVWPSVYDQENAVTVTITAGYSSVAAVPATAKQAILLLAGHWFNNREAVTDRGMSAPLAYEALVRQLRWSGYR